MPMHKWHFYLCIHFSRIWNTQSMWYDHPNPNHVPRAIVVKDNCTFEHDYLIHCKSEIYFSYPMTYVCQLRWLLSLNQLTKFEYIVQSLTSTLLLGEIFLNQDLTTHRLDWIRSTYLRSTMYIKFLVVMNSFTYVSYREEVPFPGELEPTCG